MLTNALSEIMAPTNCGSTSRNASIGGRSGVGWESILSRSESVRDLFGIRAGSVWGSCGVRSGSVRDPFGVRSEFVPGPFDEIWWGHNYRSADSRTDRYGGFANVRLHRWLRGSGLIALAFA